ncbi:MAG: hypothetical protein IPK66_16560 [Rhodospirillales bacterium]|nr:hypothetical protein [Rhodospirillales bacterium]
MNTIANAASTPRSRGKDSYATARAAEVRALSTHYDQDAASRQAFERLDRQLSSGQPLRRDVPPGYYLDVRV